MIKNVKAEDMSIEYGENTVSDRVLYLSDFIRHTCNWCSLMPVKMSLFPSYILYFLVHATYVYKCHFLQGQHDQVTTLCGAFLLLTGLHNSVMKLIQN